jgi:hypothetical protein
MAPRKSSAVLRGLPALRALAETPRPGGSNTLGSSPYASLLDHPRSRFDLITQYCPSIWSCTRPRTVSAMRRASSTGRPRGTTTSSAELEREHHHVGGESKDQSAHLVRSPISRATPGGRIAQCNPFVSRWVNPNGARGPPRAALLSWPGRADARTPATPASRPHTRARAPHHPARSHGDAAYARTDDQLRASGCR